MAPFLVQDYIDHSKDQFSENIALTYPGEQFSYKDLWISSNKLANLLKIYNIERQSRVAVYLKRSAKSVMAMIGALKADAIYVSIDSKTPIKRLQALFEDCNPAAVICDQSTIDSVVEILPHMKYNPKIVILEDEVQFDIGITGDFIFNAQISEQSGRQPTYQNIDTDIAQIIYTSGSTGTPKGVKISHLNIFNYIEWAVEEFQISHEDVILGTAPFHFDMSTFDIFCSLKAGCTFCISPDMHLLFPKKLINLIDKEKVTIWKGISSLLMYLAKTHSIENNDLKTLNKIIFAGEVLPTKYLIEWMTRYPEKEFYNGYGPSEGTGMSTYYKVEKIPGDPMDNIPIGKSRANCEVIILKDNNFQAGIEEIGEICIRGSGVSSGYWNDPEKTKNAFVSVPISGKESYRIYKTGDLGKLRRDGNIDFIGRKDHQVKWMGYRIELGEIESTLLSFNEINDAVVLLYENGSQDNENELIACVEAAEKSDLTQTMGQLSSILPHYMVPKRIVCVDEIPRSERGKIDRKKLLEYCS